MEFLENFVKNLDVINFIIIIIVTIVLTLFSANYFKICGCDLKSKTENLELIDMSSINNQSNCNCDEPVKIARQTAQEICATQIAQISQPVKSTQPKQSNPPYKLSFYYSNRCGYCKIFKPEWQKIKSTVTNSELNNVIQLVENDCEQNPSGCQADSQYIEGMPTILLTKSNGQKVKYNDYPRTHDSVLKFLQQNM